MFKIAPKPILLFLLFVFVSSCTTANAPPLQVGQRPSLETDEAGLWMRADRAEKEIQTSPLLVTDEGLTTYVEGLVCRLAGAYCSDVRVYVVDLAAFNANMSPNGVMQVWTGLLLRAENEAQLAYVLGHEIGHYLERHSLERWRTVKSNASAALVFGMVAGAGGVPELASLGQLAALSSIFGHSRENEREADRMGFEAFTRAGYDPRQAVEIWQSVVEEVDKSDYEKKRERRARGSAFDTHPLTTERIATLEKLANSSAPGDLGTERYRAATDPFLGDWLRKDLRRKDYGETLYIIDKLLSQGRRPGTVNFYKGETYRLRRSDGDEQAARQAYETASRYDDAPPDVWRELGQVYWRANNLSAASSAFSTYLEKAPGATDRLIVQDYIRQIGS